MMKKIILLGLLSLSMCLTEPTEEKVSPSPTAIAAATNTTEDTKEKIQAATVPSHVQTEITTKNATETKTASTQMVPEKPKPSEATLPHKEETSKPVDNKTAEKEVPKAKDDSKELPKNSNETKVTTENAITNKPINVSGKNATTMKPDVPTSTQAPKSEDKHVLQSRSFDGPSFIGGIILTLGLLAIGFMGFKYYKNQTERNYHTL